MNSDDKALLNAIKEIRVRNNDPWMEIVQIALESNRDRTLACLTSILCNDQAVSELVKGLIYDR
jgi:hypothetical protein